MTAVLEGVADSVKVPEMLIPSDVEYSGTEITLVGKTRLIKEFDREDGEFPKAFPSETSVLVAVPVAEKFSLLGLEPE